MNSILTPAYEGIFLFRMWMQSKIEKERLEKENIIVKYETLKNQVNPHFLFNSLNTLSSLVHTDPDKAVNFIDELARVYRYVLEKRHEQLVNLNDEIGFIESFLFLQKIRFGENLRTKVEVNREKRDLKLPPLALQIAVENCIKHNEISTANPLTINIKDVGDKICIRNNLQPRSEGEISTGTGIENLTERYRMLGEKCPQFRAENGYYVAEIPLITGT
jgi:LytS/YehU family sensor histidine kinase